MSVMVDDSKYLDFDTDCGYAGCRAMSHNVNDSFCTKHRNYLRMTDEERNWLKTAKWSLKNAEKY